MNTKLLFTFCLLLFGFQPVYAQTPSPQVRISVRVLDADDQPVAGLRVELVIFQYAMSVEPIPARGCETNAMGMCHIETGISPSSGDRYEGVFYVADLGQQLVGWQGNETEIVIHLTSDGFLPTEEPPIHGPYTGEKYAPTEGPPANPPTLPPSPEKPTATIYSPTRTPAPTPSPSPIVSPSAIPVVMIILVLLVVGGILVWVFIWRPKRHG